MRAEELDPRSVRMATDRIIDLSRSGIIALGSSEKIGNKISQGLSRVLMISWDLELLDIKRPNLEWLKFSHDNYYVKIVRNLNCLENHNALLPFKMKSPEAQDFLMQMYDYFSQAYDVGRRVSINLYSKSEITQ